jgi:hypothetical protein
MMQTRYFGVPNLKFWFTFPESPPLATNSSKISSAQKSFSSCLQRYPELMMVDAVASSSKSTRLGLRAVDALLV